MSAAAGPVIGGVLVAHLGWRAVFFLTVLPALVTGVLALAVRVPIATQAAPRTPSAGATDRSLSARLDLPGACLLAVALLCLVHTLVALPERGWTVVTATGAVAAAAACAAFLHQERRSASPLLPLGFLGSPPVAAALAVLLSASAAMFGALFVSTYFLQDVLGLDPL
ncbi:MFS transporter [Streptomyces sp. Edi2]|uniref:MFS transporter n=1 Tax=Streptomyces sp. Edi2 TaxID=3162528 RepID=UPI0033060619